MQRPLVEEAAARHDQRVPDLHTNIAGVPEKPLVEHEVSGGLVAGPSALRKCVAYMRQLQRALHE